MDRDLNAPPLNPLGNGPKARSRAARSTAPWASVSKVKLPDRRAKEMSVTVPLR